MNAGRAMDPHIGHAVEPRQPLRIQVRVPDELAPVEEIAAYVAHRPLDLPLRLRAIRTTGANAEAPVACEAKKLGILEELAASGKSPGG
jgi:hypothetical protein